MKSVPGAVATGSAREARVSIKPGAPQDQASKFEPAKRAIELQKLAGLIQHATGANGSIAAAIFRGCRPLRGLYDFYSMCSWGSASLHPRAGSPAEHLGWGGSLYADTRFAGWEDDALMILPERLSDFASSL
jgi:hypothetical protein